MEIPNRAWVLADRPVGRPVRLEDLELREIPAPAPPAAEELVLKLRYLTFAPALKLQMENAAPYAAPLAIGQVLSSSGVAEVASSGHPDFAVGDLVCGTMAWSEYALAKPAGRGFRRLLRLDGGIAPPVALALLQSGGLTAYFGLREIGRAKAGDTVAVSGAAGAVGSNVGQIAKILGCRVVGIAGGPAKCSWLKEIGFDGAIDYRRGRVAQDLAELCPGGLDLFFDNVGGEVLEAGIDALARRGRVVVCGAVAQYGQARQAAPIRNHMQLVFKSAALEGFLVTDFEDRFDAARAELTRWHAEGRLTPRFDVLDGFLNAPAALVRMLEGGNFGRQMLRLHDDG